MSMRPQKLFSDIELPLEDEHVNLARLDRILSGFYSLAGGIVLSTVFIDVIPHVQSMLHRYEKQNRKKIKFPIAYFLICIGFMITFAFIEISKKIWRYHAKKQKEGMKRRRREANMMVAAIVFALAMSTHAFLEGFALLQNTTNRIVELLFALMLHKVVEAISTGNSSQAKREKIIAIVTAVLVFGLMIPLGSAVGSVIDIYQLTENQQERLTLVFESLAGGIFVYVAMQIIFKQQKKEDKRAVHLWIVFLGFCLVVGLHLTFGSVILRAAGGDEEELYPDIFEERASEVGFR